MLPYKDHNAQALLGKTTSLLGAPNPRRLKAQI